MFRFSRMLPLNWPRSSLSQVCGFFRRWSRLSDCFGPRAPSRQQLFWPYHGLLLPPSFVLPIGWCVVIMNGAIAAMSFLPPVREVFAIQS
jgi:hypothetical protein